MEATKYRLFKPLAWDSPSMAPSNLLSQRLVQGPCQSRRGPWAPGAPGALGAARRQPGPAQPGHRLVTAFLNMNVCMILRMHITSNMYRHMCV